MKKLGLDHPFFAPVWRRWVAFGGLAGWTVFELTFGNVLWGMLFGGFAVACAYAFFGGAVDYSKYEDGGSDDPS